MTERNASQVLDSPAIKKGPSHAIRRVIICAGTGCMANGAMKVFEEFKQQIAGADLNVVLELRPEGSDADIRLSKSGCQGFCQMGPLVSVLPDNILYNQVRRDDVADIVTQTLKGGAVVERLLYKDPATRKSCRGPEENPFYARQKRFVLHECGFLDPEDIREFMQHGGYKAARKAYVEMSPEEICKTSSTPGCADAAAADSRPAASGTRRECRIRRRSTSSATATRAIPARS
jgi:NADH-quinone oxidoreductase subunit F